MKRKSTTRIAAGLVTGVLALTACGSDGNDADVATTEAESVAEQAEVGTIVDVAVGAGTFDTLVAAVSAAGLAETLSGEGPFTVFAPTDEAFAALPAGLVDALLLPENEAALVAVLTYHVLGAEVPSSDVATGAVGTLQGEEIELVVDDNGVTVNGANVIAVDVEASNGVIHVIDAVLVPPSIDATALLVANAMEEEAMEEQAEVGTIVDVAVGAGTFDTLVAAVSAAGLAETLSGEGPFTVFAPTDEAFAALPAGLVDALLLPENEAALVAVLTYHVLGAEVPSSDVATGAVGTLQGEEIELVVDDNGVTVNGANVIAVDVEASNGVIHVIDAVLVPPSVDPGTLLS
jgi:uncharacterized surface protein with fasciclin (FAS1) repeats